MNRVLFLGKNTITPPENVIEGPRYAYMYVRIVESGAIHTSYSNDIYELKKIMEYENRGRNYELQ